MSEGLSRPPPEQRQHDRQVELLARGLRAQGYAVAAALAHMDAPPPLPGGLPGCESAHCRTPDLYCTNGKGGPLIVEVETESTVAWPRTRCQLTLFPRHGRTLVYVPWPYRPRMERSLRSWGIEGVEVIPY